MDKKMHAKNYFEPAFVCDERTSIVSGIVLAYENVVSKNKPLWVSLEGPSGCGKTRIVREFYKVLASRQSSHYWPANLLSDHEGISDVQIRRKQVYPVFTTKRNTHPGFMWFGLSCDQLTNGSTSSNFMDELQQFENHRLPLLYSFFKKAPKSLIVKRNLVELGKSVIGGGVDDLKDRLKEEGLKELLGQAFANLSGMSFFSRPLIALMKEGKKATLLENIFEKEIRSMQTKT